MPIWRPLSGCMEGCQGSRKCFSLPHEVSQTHRATLGRLEVPRVAMLTTPCLPSLPLLLMLGCWAGSASSISGLESHSTTRPVHKHRPGTEEGWG